MKIIKIIGIIITMIVIVMIITIMIYPLGLISGKILNNTNCPSRYTGAIYKSSFANFHIWWKFIAD